MTAQPAGAIEGVTPGSFMWLDMPFETYCALDGINASALKGNGRHSPIHLRAALEGKLKNDDTPDRRFGRAVHGFNLEHDKFAEQFPRAKRCAAIIKSGANEGKPCGNQGTRVSGGQWYCGTKSHAPDGAVEATDYVTDEEFARLTKLRDALKRSTANDYLRRPSYNEVVIQWQKFGLTLKTRIDKLSVTDSLITHVDLKKCQVGKANYIDAQSACEKNRYYIQSWFHVAAVQAQYGTAIEQDPNFLFIEDNEPFDTYLLPVDMEQDIKIADREVVAILNRYVTCQRSGKWEGCQPTIFPGKRGILPAWFVKQKLHGE